MEHLTIFFPCLGLTIQRSAGFCRCRSKFSLLCYLTSSLHTLLSTLAQGYLVQLYLHRQLFGHSNGASGWTLRRLFLSSWLCVQFSNLYFLIILNQNQLHITMFSSTVSNFIGLHNSQFNSFNNNWSEHLHFWYPGKCNGAAVTTSRAITQLHLFPVTPGHYHYHWFWHCRLLSCFILIKIYSILY